MTAELSRSGERAVEDSVPQAGSCAVPIVRVAPAEVGAPGKRIVGSGDLPLVAGSLLDDVACEEPLEIRIAGRPFAVTLRTPGEDRHLALGFLFAEAVIGRAADVVSCVLQDCGHRLEIELGADALDGWANRRVAREIRMTSACGACGKPTLEDLYVDLPRSLPAEWNRELVFLLPARMRERQILFSRTGGIHAAALFSPSGELLAIAEDVGRHNAVDKVVGSVLLNAPQALAGSLLAVSGRVGFELGQKALRARCAAMIAVGAASSSAIELARCGGLELYSFAGACSANLHA